MLERCRNDEDDALVRRIFRNKNESRDAVRWQEWQIRRGFAPATVQSNQVRNDVPGRISYSSRIYGRSLLISPSPQGRQISFGDVGSCNDNLVDNSPIHNETMENSHDSAVEPSPLIKNNENISIEETCSTSITRPCQVKTLEETSSISKHKNDDLSEAKNLSSSNCQNKISVESSLSLSKKDVPFNNGKKDTAGSTDKKINSSLESSAIDTEILNMIDMVSIREKIKSIRKKGDVKRADQLREDSWVVQDILAGVRVSTDEKSMVEAASRMIELFLLEVDDSEDQEADSSPTKTEEEVPLVPKEDEQARQYEVDFDVVVGEAETSVVEAPGKAATEESDDEFFDCLDNPPYDPIANGFFD